MIAHYHLNAWNEAVMLALFLFFPRVVLEHKFGFLNPACQAKTSQSLLLNYVIDQLGCLWLGFQ